MTYARIVDGKVKEIISFDPTGRYPEEWDWVECGDDIVQGASYDGSDFANPVAPELPDEEQTYRTKITRVEFKSLFTIAERVGIRKAREYTGSDETQVTVKYTLDEFYDVLDDPQLTVIDLQAQSIAEGLEALQAANFITAERKDQIALGVPVNQTA